MERARGIRCGLAIGDALGAQDVAVILHGVPGRLDWGWFFRNAPRMALHTVNAENRQGDVAYEVCLRETARRVFEGRCLLGVLKAPRTTVHSRRTSVETQWVSYMISKRWLTVELAPSGRLATLIAYGNYPGRFSRTVDLVDISPSLPTSRASPRNSGFGRTRRRL